MKTCSFMPAKDNAFGKIFILALNNRTANVIYYNMRRIIISLTCRIFARHTPPASRTEATALSIDDEFRLVVEYDDGRREALSAGEVSVRGMYGYV